MVRRPSGYTYSWLRRFLFFVLDSLLPVAFFVGEIMGETTQGYPRALDIRIDPGKYIDALEARIKELEENAEGFARYIDEACVEFERLREELEGIVAQIKDIQYNAWEDRNGWDI